MRGVPSPRRQGSEHRSLSHNNIEVLYLAPANPALSRGGVRCCFVNRTLPYGALISCVVGIYVFVVGYLGALFRTSGNLPISLVATGIVAVPVRPAA